MDIEEANKLVNKSMKVIRSCKTMSQLKVAISHVDLFYNRISRTFGLVNGTKIMSLTDRSIDFALRQIKNKEG